MLEDRIAPAALAGQVLTYTDIDGDHVSITISKGTLAQSDFTFSVASPFASNNAAAPMQLQDIDLHGAAGVTGANITMKVTKANGGDGLAAIGAINATSLDLGTVTIAGDLGAIAAGSNGASNIAIKALSARSIGYYGEATQSTAAPTLTSLIQGRLGALTLKTDLSSGTTVNVSDSTAANSGIGPITIGGSILGTLESAGGGMGPITVKNSITGVVTEFAGPIAGIKVAGSVLLNAAVSATAGAIGPVTIGGSLYDSASITSPGGSIGTVRIGGSVYAQSAITASGNIGAITLGGSLSDSQVAATGAGAITSVSIGGNVVDDGVIQTNTGKLGNVAVRGSIADSGGLSTTSGDIGTVKISGNLETGAQIISGGALGAVSIGGSAFGNISAANGMASLGVRGELSSQVQTTGGNIGVLTVGADAIGASISSAGTMGAVKITGLLADSNISSAGSIASITVGRSVNSSQILAGTQAVSATAVNIGAVKVGGDWIGSNLSAGVKGSAGSFGEGTDTQLAASSRIASIAIAGIITGSPTSMAHFGFDAQAIGSFSYDGIKLKLPTATPTNIPLAPILGDVAIELI